MAREELNSRNSFNDYINKDTGDIFSQNTSLKYARNAILFSETGDLGYIGNEPSNELCISIEYDGGKPQIVGAIFLFDDYWAIFSTLNDQPTDNKNCEIGLFDYSRCEYIPIVRSKCLKFSPLFPIKGISRFNSNGINIYWADGYNDDRFLNLGLPEAWYKTAADRGDPTTVPWLPDFDTIPYLWYDETADDCINKKYCQPLQLNCEALRLIPSFGPISVTCKQSDKGGSLPNGLYYAAVAYSIKGQKYSNYFISPVAHLFSYNNANSLSIKILDVDESVFDEIEIVVISQVNNQLTAKIVGYYPITTKNIDITFLDPTLPAADPFDIFRNKEVYTKSNGIYDINDYAVRVGPHKKIDFNYQPLANLIRVEFGVVEYPANYYEKVNKNSYTSIYDVQADAISFMRDEVYTFYIRWIYDTGDRSPLYHIPGPPIKGTKKCDCEDLEDTKLSINQPVLQNGNNKIVQDGGKLKYYGYVDTFISDEKYDCSTPERWNFSWFKENVINKSKCKNTQYLFPYIGTSQDDYDLCCKNIRLVRIPSEQDYPELKLYEDSNNTIRYIGLRFSNIYHPLDNEGNPIKNIVGFEILRASREGNKTIIAKGIVERMIKYDSVDEKNQTNRNRLFANFPYDPYTQNQKHYWLTGERVPMRYFTSSTNLNIFFDPSPFNINLSGYDKADTLNKLFTIDFDNQYVVFRSPETSFGKPYANWDKLKVYGELYGKIENAEYFIPEHFPRYKLLSPVAYFMINVRAVMDTSIKLNGKLRIRHEGQELGLSANAISSDALGIGATMNVVILTTAVYLGLSYLGVLSSLVTMYSNPSYLLAMNTYGLTPNSTIAWVNRQMASANLLLAMLGGGKFKLPTVEVEPGIFDNYPKGMMLMTFIPMFLTTFSQTADDLEVIYKSSLPFHDYALQIATHGFYSKFERYSQCRCLRVVDSAYIGRDIHQFYDRYINNLYRTPYVIIKLTGSTNVINKLKIDKSSDLRVYGNCCGSGILPKLSSYDVIKKCGDYIVKQGKEISARYAALKISNSRPYGQLYETKNILMGLPVSIKKNSCEDIKDSDCRCNYENYVEGVIKCSSVYNTDWMLYGDVYVTRYTEKDTYLFFYDLPTMQPDGFDYDYLKRRNILYPRFWISTQKPDLLEEFYNSNPGTLCSNCNTVTPSEANNLCQDNCFENIQSFLSTFIGLNVQKSDLLSLICDISNQLNNIVQGFQGGLSMVIGGLGGVTASLFQFAIDSVTDTSCSGILDCIWMVIKMIFAPIVAILGLILAVVTIAVALVGILVGFVINLSIGVSNALLIVPMIGVALSNMMNNISFFPGNSLLGKFLIPYNLDGCPDNKCIEGGRPRVYAYGIFGLWFYVAISSVRDFYVESEYNMAFRLNGDEAYTTHFSVYKNSNLLFHFNIKNLKAGDSFLYDNTMMASKQFIGFASHGILQPRHYNPKIQDYLSGENPFMLLYSLPFNRVAGLDGNRIYLPNNYAIYDDEIVGLKSINDSGSIVLFKHSAPLYYAGVDRLNTDAGIKINIGDGVLFEQPTRNAVNSDVYYQYGSCQSPFAIVNTPLGIFYISNTNGRIFQYGDGLRDLTLEAGISRWAQNYLRFKINDYIKDFKLLNNPIDGVGSNVVYDSKYNLVYFTKRDYDLKKKYKDDIDNGLITIDFFTEYVDNLGVKYYNVFVVKDSGNNVIDIFDFGSAQMSKYFDDVSLTISYSPVVNKFISYHDWVPDLAYGSNNGFFTINENEIWKHNSRCDSYCNFYGVQYPFEIEFEEDLGNNVTTIRNLEINLEARKYSEDCTSYHHKLDYFFDRLVIYNSEQCSGYLDLVMQYKNNPIQNLQYPKVTLLPSIEVLWSKVEQKYRINQFYDIVKDRGEYSGTEDIFILIEPNGYIRKLDNTKLDYNKFFTEHKRFRHFVNRIWLIKDYRNGDNDKKMILMIADVKKQISFR